MITERAQKLLILLETIEKTVSNIYGSLAVNQNFGDEAKRFWATMMGAELEHASLFKRIREQAQKNKGLQLELRFKKEDLLKSYHMVKKAEKTTTESSLNEKMAYTLASNIEEKLYEYSYSKRVICNNKELMEKIKNVDDETKEHYFLLHNKSLDPKGSFQ